MASEPGLNTSLMVEGREVEVRIRVDLTSIPILIELINVLSLGDPVHISTQIFLHLLLLTKLLEISSSFRLLSLLREFSTHKYDLLDKQTNAHTQHRDKHTLFAVGEGIFGEFGKLWKVCGKSAAISICNCLSQVSNIINI